MKYSNNNNKFSRFSILMFSFVLSILVIIVALLLVSYPIQLTSQNLGDEQKWYARFFSPWPASSFKTESIERKKLQRSSKYELQKRIDKQLQNSRTLHVPLYDFWLDSNAEMNLVNSVSVPESTSFIWPVLPISLNHPAAFINKNRQPYFVFFPDNQKVKIVRGSYLGSGESIRSSIPLSNVKRYLVLECLPLIPGHIKVTLGQYVWTKTFTEDDIHQEAKFLIPINDALAQNYRIANLSSSLYVLNLKVVNVVVNTQTMPPSSDTIVSRGSNVFFMTVDDFDSSLMKDKKRLANIMPGLSAFYENSLLIDQALDAREFDSDRFKVPPLYQKYGYKTTLFTSAETVSLADQITSFKNFNTISNEWLTDSDASLQLQNSIKNTDTTIDGLNAIFKIENESLPREIQEKHFQDLSRYLKQISLEVRNTDRLQFDENFLISKKHYVPSLLDVFQSWLPTQNKNRLFIDMDLSTASGIAKPTLQDFAFILRHNFTLNFKRMHMLARLHMLDRELSQILEDMQTRLIDHRTILFLVLKDRVQPSLSSAVLFVPGVLRQPTPPSSNMSLQDLALYSMSLAGVPETVLPNDREQYTQYNLVIEPNLERCESFVWHATNAVIFDTKANFPFYQVNNPGEIEFFPCGFGAKTLEMVWYQKHVVDEKNSENQSSHQSANQNSQHVNGYFLQPKLRLKNVELFYGKQLVNTMNFPFDFTHSSDQMRDLFLVDKKEIDSIRSLAIRTFQTMKVDSNLPKNTRVALLISEGRQN